MVEFRRLSDSVLVAPQIDADDIAQAAEQGVTSIVQNRPDGEEAGQPDSAVLAKEAERLGIAFASVPVTGAGFSRPQIDAMRDAIDAARGKVLAFCRSGTRSTLLWSLVEADRGRDPEVIAANAAAAGYDLAPVRAMMDMLAGKSEV